VNGIHDLGGMHGFGRVEIEENEPPFHAPWEGRVVGIFMQLLLRGYFNLDAFRHGIETMEPSHYLRASYFERWRTSIEKNLVAVRAVAPAELEERIRALRERSSVGSDEPKRIVPAPPPPRPPQPGFVREVDAPPRYAVGDAVRGRNLHPRGHTRLPRYARGARGRVERVYPAFVFPDTNAHGQGENPQYLYNVRFDGRELWGDAAEPGVSVSLDLFESYLEADG
jgi:nitrile hydratase